MTDEASAQVAALAATFAGGWVARRKAVLDLAHVADRPEVRARLIELFEDPDLAVVAVAAVALVEHGGDQGVDAVLRLCRDGPDDAGYAVRDALAGLVHRDDAAAQALIRRARVDAGPTGRELLDDLQLGEQRP